MSEINGPKFSVNQVNFNGVQKSSQEIQTEPTASEEPKIKDFSDPNEVSGRSLLIKGADGINGDLKAILDNPEIVNNSDKMFETTFKALSDAGVAEAYEKASTFATGQV